MICDGLSISLWWRKPMNFFSFFWGGVESWKVGKEGDERD